MLSQARLAVYLTVAFGGGAVILSALGAADYDSATGLLDIHPIDIKQAALVVAGPMALEDIPKK